MRAIISNQEKNKTRETIRSMQEQKMRRMVGYQKNMERFLNRRKINHHMIRKG